MYIFLQWRNIEQNRVIEMELKFKGKKETVRLPTVRKKELVYLFLFF